ncbi:MAG: transcription termination factor Rho [Gemmatimonadaceae bacterium]|nr:transcription termination factor Rho [Gemmatimonadaceae bacterium]
MHISELRRAPLPELVALAESLGISEPAALRRIDLTLKIEHALLAKGEELLAEGVLEIVKEGHGFLRSPDNSYLASAADVYVSQTQIRRFSARTGDTLRGRVRAPKPWEKFLALLQIESINGRDPELAQGRIQFDNLRPAYPKARLRLERADSDLTTRLMDIIAPLGKGQRGLIVAPPRAGKTILLHKMATAISENHPEVTLIVLLIDERPEEVTDFIATVPGAEVIASTFDEKASRHVQVAEMTIERAKRLVEEGRDVVILLDSITRLARAHNTVIPMSGRLLSGGVDAKALERPKRFFGAARAIDGGGTLTIVATALVGTGSRMDEVIFEEFKGTGNMELVLDRDIANRRIFPAIEIQKSGTRKEELLLTPEEKNRIFLIRHFLGDMPPEEQVLFLAKRMGRTKTNAEFFKKMVDGDV